MTRAEKYGGAYMFDGYKWHYAWGGEVPEQRFVFDQYTETYLCDAPELLPQMMLSISDVAQHLEVKRSTVSRMLNRGDICPPQFRDQRCALWSRPVFIHWLQNRPGKGAHLRKKVA